MARIITSSADTGAAAAEGGSSLATGARDALSAAIARAAQAAEDLRATAAFLASADLSSRVEALRALPRQAAVESLARARAALATLTEAVEAFDKRHEVNVPPRHDLLCLVIARAHGKCLEYVLVPLSDEQEDYSSS